jgi:hypothetical protein
MKKIAMKLSGHHHSLSTVAVQFLPQAAGKTRKNLPFLCHWREHLRMQGKDIPMRKSFKVVMVSTIKENKSNSK